MKNKKLLLLNGITIFLPLILGGICSIFINTNQYKMVSRPPLSPPSIVFPIVWSILYLLIGISFYKAKKDVLEDKISIPYYVGLAVNLMWPFIFFNAKLYFLAALWIILLIGLLIKLMYEYYKINKISFYLQIPYLLWLCFALYLNVGVWILN